MRARLLPAPAQTPRVRPSSPAHPLRALTPLACRPLALAHTSAPLTPRLPSFFCRWQPGPTGQTRPLPSFASPLPMASAPRGLLRDSAAPWVSPAPQGVPASLIRASPLLEASPPSQDHADAVPRSAFHAHGVNPEFLAGLPSVQPRPGSLFFF